MYEGTQKREELRMRFLMHIHGFSLKDEADQPILNESQPKKIPSSGFMFKAPSEYAAMTPEERERETKRMMGMHKQWAAGTKSVPLGVN